MHIIVGSTNPVKINAVLLVAESLWPGCEVSGFEAESGVSVQPRTDEETKRGSITRAQNALKSAVDSIDVSMKKKSEVLGVGLEGGVFETENGEMWNTVWVSVADRKGRVYSVNGSRFLLPEKVAEGIRAGEEMGSVVDRIAGIENIKHKQGFIGYMTSNVVDRTTEYSNLARLALGIWVGSIV